MVLAHLRNPAFRDTSFDARAATFENPTGVRSAGGSAACTSYVDYRDPRAVPLVDVAAAVADIGRRSCEEAI